MHTPSCLKVLAPMILCLGAPLAGQSVYTPYTFSTLAGRSAPPGQDGTGPGSQFNDPQGMAMDGSGNVYIADANDCTIRKMTPGYVVTTIAGTAGVVGFADGVGGAAQFDFPCGITLDKAGNIYVADTGNNVIRKISPGGGVTTLAGTPGVLGSADGEGPVAQFSSPWGMAVDASGNVYVADSENCTVREISPSGVVHTIAGEAGQIGSADGVGSAARFSAPLALAVDPTGNVYVDDTGNQVIRRIAQGGLVTTIAGTVGTQGNVDGTGSSAEFAFPDGITADQGGNVYVSDLGVAVSQVSTTGISTTLIPPRLFYGSTIRKVTPLGVVTTLAGSPQGWTGFANGTGSLAIFNKPAGIVLSANGNLIVADSGNNLIRTITPDGVVTTAAGGNSAGSADGTGTSAQFNAPQCVAVDGVGNAYVADPKNNLIRKVSPGGVVTTLAGIAGIAGSADGQGATAQFNNPAGVAVDGSGNVYVADCNNQTIRKITPGGSVATLAGTAGSAGYGSADGTGSAAQFKYPQGVAVDVSGNVYVADTENDTIRKITQNGVVTTLAGTPDAKGSADGTGSTALFILPMGVAVDGAGNIYVADYGDSTIRKVTPAGVVTTLAGNAGNIGSADGTGSAALFGLPQGVAVDSAGNVYVADASNDAIRKITPGGAVTTLAGVPRVPGGADGTGSAARFNYPTSVAVDTKGNVYVADTDNNTIRVGDLNLPFTVQPQSETSNAGSTVVFTAAAAGAASYQWEFNGIPIAGGLGQTISNVISGATGPQLMIANVTAASAGSYTCIATDSGGTNASTTVNLSVTTASNPGVLTSFSVRGFVGTGDNILIGGFYIAGSTSVTVLVQAVGPALAAAPYNVTGTLQHPTLTIHQNLNGQDVVLNSNTGWGSNPVLLNAAAAVYAQPVLQPNSTDSELLLTLPPGGYTAEATGADGGTGVALCAVYVVP